MKKSKNKQLKLEKFSVAKLNNLSTVYGGSGTEDDGQGETITNQTQLPPTQRPTQG